MAASQHRQFILNTSIFDSKLWHASPWKLKVLIYLIANANTRHSEHLEISIEKGQLLRSYRRIAMDCSYKKGFRTLNPSPTNIKHHCDNLESEGRISQLKTKYGVLFTLTAPIEPESKPKPRSSRPVQKSLFSHHPFITEKERTLLAHLDSIEGYQFDLDTDFDFVHSFSVDFPSLDLIEQIKGWKTWLWDNRKDLKGKVNYRLRLRNWLKIESAKGDKNAVSNSTKKFKPSYEESEKFAGVYED